MNDQRNQAKQALTQARLALQNNDRASARHWAHLAANLAPELEDVWLFMAAIADPHASQTYLKRALEINPNSERARKGMHWNIQRLRALPATHRASAYLAIPALPPLAVSEHPRPILLWLVAAILLLVALTLWSGILPSNLLPPEVQAAFSNPLLSSNPQNYSAARVTGELVKPSFTPTPTYTFTPTATFTSTPTPTSTFTPTPTSTNTPTPTDTPTPLPTNTPQPTNPPSSDYSFPMPEIPDNIEAGERWIDVDLTHQAAFAFEGEQLIKSFVVSTGVAAHPTVTGQFHIYVKYRYADMAGPGYYLPDVPYVMYFYQGYGLHGTYWHNNFGHPMSHGCINFKTADAGWLFDWASVGTLVNIHY
jgi:lipoprotein-anchoring transpeptidase ErfK/SrfK